MTSEILPDIVDDGSKPESFSLSEFQMAKWASEILHKNYPGHLWGVNVQDGLIVIYNLALSGNWGFVLRESDVRNGKEGRRMVKRGGGELLERYNLSRGKIKADEMEGMILDQRGEPLGDKT